MSDLDRLLQQSLKRAAGSHDPMSLSIARERFVRTRRRRSLFTAATSLAVLAALVTTVVAAPWDRGNTDIVGPAPGPTAPPGDMLITATTDVDSPPSDLDIDGDRLFVGSTENAKISVLNPEKNNVEFVIDPFGKGTRIAGHGPTSTDVLDVSNGILTTASGGWFFERKSARTVKTPNGIPQ
ncbi:MAG TPA: hypothetical protein VEV82_03355 [Actinomycetota bacterium]|nr:hypothetical protein [Actinomycetota bacterium]